MLEVIRPRPDARPQVALFDFDGTLSLIRAGWQQIMAKMMLETLRPFSTAPTLATEVATAIERLTGHPTIMQMEWLAQAVIANGGVAESAEFYKSRYLDLLEHEVAIRCQAIQHGIVAADSFLLPGSRNLLEGIEQLGMRIDLASGTDRVDVCAEAKVLGIDHFFGERIYGPGSHDPDFSKPRVLAALLATGFQPDQIIVIGDGPVEITAAHAIGAIAVGVAYNEVHGGLDQERRIRLISNGADRILTDLTDDLLAWITNRR